MINEANVYIKELLAKATVRGYKRDEVMYAEAKRCLFGRRKYDVLWRSLHGLSIKISEMKKVVFQAFLDENLFMAETLLKQNIRVIQKELGTYESVIKMQIDEPNAIPYLGNNSFISEMQQMTKVSVWI